MARYELWVKQPHLLIARLKVDSNETFLLCKLHPYDSTLIGPDLKPFIAKGEF